MPTVAVENARVGGRIAVETCRPEDRAERGDSALVEAARSGDRAAFALLYRRYAALVHGVLLARVPAGEAEDLTQDVFTRAMTRLGGLRDADAVGPWLVAIARRSAATWRRGRWRHGWLRLVGLEHAQPATDPRADEALAGSRAEAEEVMRVIRSLPEAYRETLVLRLVEGMTGPQIADRVGMTHGSVRVNLHKGMALLRERLGAQGGGA